MHWEDVMVMGENISFEKLTDGEVVALETIEVTSIPHVSTIAEEHETTAEIVSRYQQEFYGLLNEVFQTFRTASLAAGCARDTSLEMLWKTSEVKNQPFKAAIRLFIIIRSIGETESSAEELIKPISGLCRSTLEIGKYEYREISSEETLSVVKSINDSNIRAIVKEEKVVNLQNQLLPYCYSYDRFPISNSDLSRIVNSMIDYPDCAISVQLIPTSLQQTESAELDRITQVLETLSKGVMDQGIGNVSFSLAERHAETYRYYAENKTQALYLFNVLIFGSSEGVTNIANRFYGQLSTGNDLSANLKMIDVDQTEVS